MSAAFCVPGAAALRRGGWGSACTAMSPRVGRRSRMRCVRVARATMDPYEELGVEPTAGASEIKRAYRRAALERHPDVSKAPGARERFQRAQDAYRMLCDETARARYDRAAARATSGGPGGFGDGGAAAREYARNWRRQNPMPEDLNDDLGSVLSDLFGAMRGASQGAPSVLGDLLDFLEGRTGTAGGGGAAPEGVGDEALRSRCVEVVEAEIRDAGRRESAAEARADGAEEDARALDARAKEWRRRAGNMQRVADFAARDAARGMEDELGVQSGRLRDRARALRKEAAAARELKTKLQSRLREIADADAARAAANGSEGAGKGPESREERERGQQKAVDEELERMKRELGL